MGSIAAAGTAARIIRLDMERATMDKKTKKKLQALNQRIQRLRGQLAGAKKQMDDPEELQELKQELAVAEAELAKLKGP